MPYQSINPATGKFLKTFKELTAAQLEKSLRTATACYAEWRHTSFAHRATVAARAAAILRKRVDEFARPMTLEMGKRIDEARGEVAVSADIIDYYAKNAERFLAPQKLKPRSGQAVIESSPLGALFFRVKDEDEAVALANDSDFGLGGSVFTDDIARGRRVASRIDTGMVFINHPTWTAADLPFGGIKHSGYGRELSGLGIQEFVNKKLVRVSSLGASA